MPDAADFAAFDCGAIVAPAGHGKTEIIASIAATGRITYAYLHGEQNERGTVGMGDRIPPRLLELIRLVTA